MNKRILLGALVAGLALFAWEAVAHMLTPLGTMGFKTLPDEKTVVDSINKTVRQGGLYLYPAPKEGSASDTSTVYPMGMLLVHGGSMAISPMQLLVQFLTDVVTMLVVGMILAQVNPAAPSGMRWIVVLLMSLLSTLRWGIPYINWYDFPRRLVLADLIMNVVGYAIAGYILTKMVQGRARALGAKA
jgi:hypothetical protein